MTLKEQALWLPAASVAVQVTFVVPFGKTEPEKRAGRLALGEVDLGGYGSLAELRLDEQRDLSEGCGSVLDPEDGAVAEPTARGGDDRRVASGPDRGYPSA